jgi:LEM3 (ligand-effect modulator 3) family / CDC50 family
VKSRSFNQLKGDYLEADKLTDCDPIKRNKDLKPGQLSVSKGPLLAEGPAIPCGLVAKSFFDDSYILTRPNGTQVTIKNDNIAWESDKLYKFKNTAKPGVDWKTIQWLDMEDGMNFLFNFCRALHRVDAHGRPA